MRKLLFITVFLLAAIAISGQARNTLNQKCAGSSAYATAGFAYNGAFFNVLCSGQSFTIGSDLEYTPLTKRLKLVDVNFSPFLNATNYLSIGNNLTGTPLSLSNHFVGTETGFLISPSGASKTFIANKTTLNASSVSATGSSFYGNVLSIDFRTPADASNFVTGYYAFLNLDGQFNEGYGANITAAMGGSGASGSSFVGGGKFTASVSHQGTLTTGTGLEGRIASSSNTIASTTTTANALRGTVSLQNNLTVTNLRGLSFDNWTTAGSGTATTTSVIYADSSVDIGATRYFINSASTSPSKLAGDVYISDNTKGIILRSPDNSCYRFTVANGGALNAGVLVTCP